VELECDGVVARDISSLTLRWFENPLFCGSQRHGPDQAVIPYPIFNMRFDNVVLFVDADLNVDFRSLLNVRRGERFYVRGNLLQSSSGDIISYWFRFRHNVECQTMPYGRVREVVALRLAS